MRTLSAGAGEHYVVEADESDGSFVYLSPFVSVITNIEADHLDHYESLEQIERTFADFMQRPSRMGARGVRRRRASDRDCRRERPPVVTYGFDRALRRAVRGGRSGRSRSTVQVLSRPARASSVGRAFPGCTW